MSVDAARSIANKLRFSRDIRGDNIDYSSNENEHDVLFLESGILVNDALFPDLSVELNKVCERLSLPREKVHLYILNDSSPNAFCYRAHPDFCRLSVSSGLVSLLSQDELGFVIGHELGHYLLDHVFENDYKPHPANEAFLSDSRAREISADRIGMYACGSLEAALKAMIRTQTGLSENHIRFDVAEFIRQLPSFKKATFQSSTHPNFYMRARFLLWASMAGDLTNELHKSKCDQKIETDLNNFFDNKVQEQLAEILKELRFWLYVLVASYDGVFSKDEQEQITSMGYGENVYRLKQFLSGCTQEEVKERLVERCLKYIHQLSKIERDGGKSLVSKEIEEASVMFAENPEKVFALLTK